VKTNKAIVIAEENEYAMPKVVVVYDSNTGNTEVMAKAVAEGAGKVENVQLELYKVGTRFPMSVLNGADAIIIGSPTEYGNATLQMRGFLNSMLELFAAKKLRLKGKPGGVFGSYGWDGGWVVDILVMTLRKAGMKIVPPVVSAPEKLGIGSLETELLLPKCRELGYHVAMKVSRM
jgi:NAD(P)H dehydrogenase (quinone)